MEMRLILFETNEIEIHKMFSYPEIKEGDFMKIGFIGAGKVGFSFGKYFACNGIALSGYYSRSIESAKSAAEFTNSKYYENLDEIVKESDALFLTVPDGQIENIWKSLKQYSLTNKIICHCSGAMPSTVFSGIEEQGAFGYSVHPLFAICDKLQSYRDLSNSYITIEYSTERFADKANELKQMFENFGNKVMIIHAEQKVKYHAAAVFASNLVTGLLYKASTLLEECGFDEAGSREALVPLFLGNCENIRTSGMVNALTGPVERADDTTVSKHLSVLSGEYQEIYRELSRALVDVAKVKNADRDYSAVEELLK